MGGAGIRSAIDAASAYLREHPEEARSTDSAATARLVEGLVVRVTGPGDASITTDMGSIDVRHGHGPAAGLAAAGGRGELHGQAQWRPTVLRRV